MSLSTEAQSYAEEKAETYFNSGDYNNSALEYERLAYLSENNELKTRALLDKANCYKLTHDYEKSLSTLYRIKQTGVNDSLLSVIKYEIALISYMLKDYNKAGDELRNMKLLSDSTLFNRYQFLYIIVLNEQRKWEEAEKEFETYCEYNTLGFKSDSLYQEKPDLKKIKKARRLSTFMPGVGQMYAGKPFNGIVNILLNGSGSLLTYYCFANNFYIIGVFTGITSVYRFYSGGVRNAGFIAKQTNDKNAAIFNDMIKKIILNNEKKIISD